MEMNCRLQLDRLLEMLESFGQLEVLWELHHLDLNLSLKVYLCSAFVESNKFKEFLKFEESGQFLRFVAEGSCLDQLVSPVGKLG
jgi:hypothetical protein